MRYPARSVPRRNREFAAADAPRQTFGELGHRLFAIGRDELVKGGKQSRVGEAIAFDAGERRFRESFRQIAERRAPFFGRGLFEQVGKRLVRRHAAELAHRASSRDRVLQEGLIGSAPLPPLAACQPRP